MSLELAIQQNTAAINALIEMLSKGFGATIVSPDALEEQVLLEPAAAGAGATKVKRAKKETKAEPAAETPAEEPAQVAPPTYTEASAKVVEVANKKGRQAAVEILSRFDGAKKLAEVKASDYAAVICACELALA
jgi:hypothetical protein